MVLDCLMIVLLFSDTINERNALVQHVYPKLREYCREKYGLEFQVRPIASHLLGRFSE